MQLKAIVDNIELAGKMNTPMCQDTGVTIFYVTLPRDCRVDVEKGIVEGVRRATKEVPLRPNAVHPITRKNPGDNVGERMPYINWKVGDQDYIEITVMTKGAGSENMSQLAMLTPAAGLKGIKEFALNTVLKAGSNPCPPTIIGMGIGGSADIAMKLAKEALLQTHRSEAQGPGDREARDGAARVDEHAGHRPDGPGRQDDDARTEHRVRLLPHGQPASRDKRPVLGREARDGKDIPGREARAFPTHER